jgi:nucleotidyltransferase/DNA polymerase involved in DNA repair
MSYKIETIEGVAKVYGEKLRAAGIKSTAQLLARGKTPKGRKEVASATGITETLVLKWTNMCDLMRIKGVGKQFSELLEKAGVDTVKELKMRVPANLHKALLDANGQHKLARQAPGLAQVENWVAHAKVLPAAMEY